MAISRAELVKELLPGLNKLFGTEYEKYDTTWAVYADYSCEDMEWRVGKIEPWWRSKHAESMQRVYKVTDAVDELAAYKKFMKEHGEDRWTK